MTLFNGLASLFGTLSEAQRMSRLMALSDRELEMRGLDRETLRRGYIAGLGAR